MMDLAPPDRRPIEPAELAPVRLDTLQQLLVELAHATEIDPGMSDVLSAAAAAAEAAWAVLVVDHPPLGSKPVHLAGPDRAAAEQAAVRLAAGETVAGTLTIEVVAATQQVGRLTALSRRGPSGFDPSEREALESYAAVAAIGLAAATAIAASHREAEAIGHRLADEEALLAAVVDGLPQGVAWGSPSRIEGCNQALASLLGDCDLSGMIGRTWADLLPAGNVGELVEEWSAEVVADDVPVINRPLSFTDCAHSDRTVLVSIVPLSSSSGSGRALSLWADVTDQQAIERRLAESARLESVGQLAAGVAHEINTPMQYIGGNSTFLEQAFQRAAGLIDELVEVAASDGADRATLEQLVAGARIDKLRQRTPRAAEQITEGIEAVSHVVRALKTFAHPGGNEFEATSLARTLHSAVAVAQHEWRHVAQVDVNLASDLPPIRAVPGLVNQAFLNLIVNAAHAIGERRNRERRPEKGHIRISATLAGDVVEVRVADDGGGIPAEIQDRVYDQFFTTKELGEGSGQGLSLCRNVVTRHGGTIAFTTSPEGTTFTVQLPVWDAEP